MKVYVATNSAGYTATVEFHNWDTRLDTDRDAIRGKLTELFEYVFIDAVKVLFEDEPPKPHNSGE